MRGAVLANDFDSQFDSHGLGQGRMSRTRAETGARDSARSRRARTPFPPPFTSVTRVQIPSGTLSFSDLDRCWCQMSAKFF